MKLFQTKSNLMVTVLNTTKMWEKLISVPETIHSTAAHFGRDVTQIFWWCAGGNSSVFILHKIRNMEKKYSRTDSSQNIFLLCLYSCMFASRGRALYFTCLIKTNAWPLNPTFTNLQSLTCDILERMNLSEWCWSSVNVPLSTPHIMHKLHIQARTSDLESTRNTFINIQEHSLKQTIQAGFCRSGTEIQEQILD